MMIVSRWLHIYLSMGALRILFFFAVTGLTLNHGAVKGFSRDGYGLFGRVKESGLCGGCFH